MSNEDELQRPALSKIFKFKMAVILVTVVSVFIVLLYYMSTQGCPAYFLNFTMRTVDCDISNVLTMSIELTVAGIFAIVLGLIFYEKQKGDSDIIIRLNKEQLKQRKEIEQVDKKVEDAFDFDTKRLNGIRILLRNFNELKQVLERIKPDDTKGPFRDIEDLKKRDEIISKNEDVIDNIPLSRDIQYNLPDVIGTLLSDAKNTPSLEQISKTSASKFIVHANPDFDSIISRITTMESTLSGIQSKITKKDKERLS